MEDEETVAIQSGVTGGARKRSHGEMLREDRRLEQSRHRSISSLPRYPRAPSDSLNRNFPPPPNFRFPGDGFDYRRPVMSQPSTEFIDLTLDLHENSGGSGAQRTGASVPQQEIIEIEDEDHSSDDTGDATANDSSFEAGHTDGLSVDISSDAESDVEVLYSQPRTRNPQTLFNFTRSRSRANELRGQANEQRIRGDTPVVIEENVRDEVVPEEQRAPRAGLANILERIPLFAGRHRNIERNFERNIRRVMGLDFDDFLANNMGDQQIQNFNPPDLDFDAVGFELQTNDQTQPPPAHPTYEAPPPPGEGFTRSPEEDDTVICPNCDNELGQGNDEIKRQIWVIRSCGHVYCGQCAKNRSKTTKVANRLTKPFSTCVVEGCGKTKLRGPKAMFMLYISS